MSFVPSEAVRVSTQVQFNDPTYDNFIADPSTIWSRCDLNTWTLVETDAKGQLPLHRELRCRCQSAPASGRGTRFSVRR